MAQSIEQKFGKQTEAALSNMGFHPGLYITQIENMPEYIQAQWVDLIMYQKQRWSMDVKNNCYIGFPEYLVRMGLR